MAAQRSITRADFLEEIVQEKFLLSDSERIIDILQEALKLKANAGGAIKKKVKEVLSILSKRLI